MLSLQRCFYRPAIPTCDDDDVLDAAFPQHIHGARNQRAAIDGHEQLIGFAETARRPSGEYNGGNGRFRGHRVRP